MCEYCSKDNNFVAKCIIENDDIDIIIVNELLYVLIHKKLVGYQQYINYCPMCGDKITSK